MFANFIYIIVALLIYATYQPSTETTFTISESLILFFGFSLLFAAYTWNQFRHLLSRQRSEDIHRLDYRLQNLVTRQSMLAVALFAIDIYGLSLPSFFLRYPLFEKIPTLLALIFLSLFVFYLAIVWFCAYESNQKLFTMEITRKAYIWSQAAFSIPLLLPYLILSAVQDMVNALPASPVKDFLNSPLGEAIYFLLFLGIVVIIAPSMVRVIWRCKPLESGEMRERIEHLCSRAGIKCANILDWPIFGGRMINAAVMGLVSKFRYLLVTRALLDTLDPAEIDTVIAHEIGHIKKYHMLFYLMFVFGFMLINYAVYPLVINFYIYLELLVRILIGLDLSQLTLVPVFYLSFLIVAFVIYFRFLFGYFMRNFERQADGFAFMLFDSAQPLISTLKKIAISSGQPPDRPNWHHFSISERIRFLSESETDRSNIQRHDRKIRRSIAAYFAVMLLIGLAGYNLKFGETGAKINQFLFGKLDPFVSEKLTGAYEKTLMRELESDPDNHQLYRALGDLYYNTKNYTGVRDAYEQSLRLKGDDPHVLNNLAWLYATCEDVQLRDPPRALELALKAAAIVEEPHILDTLAESYYVNKFYDLAVETAMRALKIARDNRGYYKKQLEKYKAAAGIKM